MCDNDVIKGERIVRIKLSECKIDLLKINKFTDIREWETMVGSDFRLSYNIHKETKKVSAIDLSVWIFMTFMGVEPSRLTEMS